VRSDAPDVRPPAVAVIVPAPPKLRSKPLDVPRPAVEVIVPEVDRRRGDWLEGPRPAVAAILSATVPDGPSPRWVMGRDGLDAEEAVEVSTTPTVRQGHD
jgi:hypothetical protein